MPNKHVRYRACDETTYLDGTPEQSEDDVYEAFNKMHGHYPSQIFSVDTNNDNTLVWEDEGDENE